MTLVADVLALAKQPRTLLEARLREATPWPALLLGTALPLMAIRALAVLVRSLLAGAPVAGVVLALNNFALQAGAWVGLALMLPALAKQFGAGLTERESVALATYGSVPLWLAGVLYLVPEHPTALWVLSRTLVAAAATYGVYVLSLGLATLAVAQRQFIVAAATCTYVLLYLVLFALLGLSSTVMLFLLGASL